MNFHPQYRDKDSIESAQNHLQSSRGGDGLVAFERATAVGAYWRLQGADWQYKIRTPDGATVDEMLGAGLAGRLRVQMELPGSVRAEAPMRGPDLRVLLDNWLDGNEHWKAGGSIVRWKHPDAGSVDDSNTAVILVRSNAFDRPDHGPTLQLQIWEYSAEHWTTIRYAHAYVGGGGQVVHADVGVMDWPYSRKRAWSSLLDGSVEKQQKVKLWRIDPEASHEIGVERCFDWFARSFRTSGEELVGELLELSLTE